MIKNYELYDGKGNLIDVSQTEVPDFIKEPSELEVRLSAIETKIGITEQEKLDAKAVLKGEL